MNRVEFMTPRLVGPRFEGGGIPLEVLKDLAVIEEMIIEVAKWKYLCEHKDRRRSPRGFIDGIELKLTGIEDGSAKPIISLFVAANPLFPAENQRFFEQARDAFVDAIAAAEQSTPVAAHLPDKALTYFDRIGRSLRDGEVFEFFTSRRSVPARLTKETRRKLVLASGSVRSLTEESVVRGLIPEVDQDDMTFEIQLNDGRKVKAPLAPPHLESVIEAFNGYKSSVRVMVQGIGRYNRSEKLQSFDSIEHVTTLDPLDIPARLDELRLLTDGWLDGAGKAPDGRCLDWFAEEFARYFSDDVPLPHLYPTAEGGLQAEWSLGAVEISLEIDLIGKRAFWQAVNLETGHADDFELDLGKGDEWLKLADAVRKQSEGQT